MAANIMRSSMFKSIVEPILNEAFNGVYDQRKDEYKQVFKVSMGIPRTYHEEPVQFGFGAAPELPDGQPVTYQAGGILFNKRYVYQVFGLAYALTKVLVEDGDHVRLGTTYSKHLAQSMIETDETNAVNIINRAYNASFPGGDGVALGSNAHPLAAGTFSNILPVSAALSQTSLEQMLILLRTNGVDNNNKKIRLMPQKLVVAPANELQATVLLNSVLRTGTNNNDINPVKSMGYLKEVAVMSRMTSATQWGLSTDAPEGFKVLIRRNIENSMEGDFETDSVRYKSTMRKAYGFTDPRCFFSTPGV
jgi:hypothetical protein